MSRRPMDPVQSKPEYSLIDLFSGSGGTSAGFASTGAYRLTYAADIDLWANRTYELNLGVAPDPVDLQALVAAGSYREWARHVRARSTLPLVLIGCAPCQGFSSHVKAVGDRYGRNNLLDSLGELAVALGPEAILVENVPDLFARRNWDSYVRLRTKLTQAGYGVRARIMNFAEFGVPQERFRGVILARRGARPTFPAALHRPGGFSTVRDWIGSLPPLSAGARDPSDPMHQTSQHRPSTVELLAQIPKDGGSRPVGVGPRCLDDTRRAHGGYTDVYGRLAWDSPAPTITARCRTPSCGRFAHPEQNRGLSVREAALLQTFPERWVFEGPFDERFKQVGNAVPPLAAYAIGMHVASRWPEVDREAGTLEIIDKPVGESFSVLIPGVRRRALRAAA